MNNFKSRIYIHLIINLLTLTKDYCITGRANTRFSVQLAFAKFLSKIKGNF